MPVIKKSVKTRKKTPKYFSINPYVFLLVSLFASPAQADFSAEAGYGILMLLLYPFVLIIFTLIAPNGIRLVTFFITLIGAPLTAYTSHQLLLSSLGLEPWGFLSDQQSRVWLAIVSCVTIAALILLTLLRISSVRKGGAQANWDTAKMASGVLGALLIWNLGVLLLHQDLITHYVKSLNGLVAIAFYIATVLACIGLWQHRKAGWWLALFIVLWPIIFVFFSQPVFLREFEWWIALLPKLCVLGLLLLPGTRNSFFKRSINPPAYPDN